MLLKRKTDLCWLLDDTSPSFWLGSYNDLVLQIKSGKLMFSDELLRSRLEECQRYGENDFQKKRSAGLGKHHILPRSLFPELETDPMNWVMLPFKEHMDLHYFLWRHDPIFAKQLWFGCAFGRKHHLWNLPGGDAEYEILKNSLRKHRVVTKT